MHLCMLFLLTVLMQADLFSYGECFNDDINEIYQVYKGFKMLDVGQKNIKPKRLMEPFDQYGMALLKAVVFDMSSLI